jgi:MYXO-CTERM domain-containing protein
VVPLSEVAAVMVQTTPEAGHQDGDWLAALPQAYDGNGARVFGVGYAWRAGGLERGGGEVYRYQLKQGPGETLTVSVQNGTYSAGTAIHATGGYPVSAYGSSGCSSSGGGGSLLVGLVGLGLVCVRRRRRDTTTRTTRATRTRTTKKTTRTMTGADAA